MRYKFLLLFFSQVLFAGGSSFTFSQNTNGAITVFPINPSFRGADIVAHFGILNAAPFKTPRSQIGLQTTNNGLITNIQFLIPTQNNTILIAAYLLPSNGIPRGSVGKDGSGRGVGYVAIPVEQTVSLIYSPGTMSTSDVYTSSAPPGTLPVFSVDLPQRAADIAEAVALMVVPPIANPRRSFSPVSLKTMINGPYYTDALGGGTSIIENGIIPQVVRVIPTDTPNSSLLRVEFKPFRTNQFTSSEGVATVIVATDQVIGILFNQD